MLKRNVVALTVLAVLSGCKSTTHNICPASTRVELPNSSQPMKGTASTKVIVFAPEMAFSNNSAKRISASLDQTLTSQINKTGAKIVDRKLAKKLMTEIQIAEESGRVSTDGVAIADMAILPKIGVADFSREFSEARSWTKDGKSYSSPASCTFKADVEASVRVVSLPSMQTLKTVELKGDNLTIVETRNSSCPMSQQEINSVIAKAAKSAVTRNAELQNLLAPKGAVIEMRQCEGNAMVKIDIGSNHSIAPEQEVKFTTYDRVDIGDGKFEVESFGYGDGEVINSLEHGIKPTYSWIVIDEEVAKKVKKGDTAKPFFEGNCDMGFISVFCENINSGIGNLFKF